MKIFILFLALFLCFSSFAHLCNECSYSGCTGNMNSSSLSHLYICPNYANGQGHHVWSEETGIYPVSCLTCGGLMCPTHGVHSGGESCPGACPNRTDCNKQTCSVCSSVYCNVHGWHGSQEITFACGVTVKQCFSSESSMNSWLSSLVRSCSVSACAKCMTPWCRNHGSHNCSVENTCPNGSDCVTSKCLLCGAGWCSTHSSHICNGDTGGNTGGNTGGDNTGGNTGGDNTGGNTGGDTGGNTGGDTGGNTGGDSTGGDNTGAGGDETGGTDLSPVISAIGSVRDSVEGTKDYIERLEGTVDGLREPIGRVEDSVRFVDDTLNIIDNTIKDKGNDIVDKLTVGGTPASPPDFAFEKEQPKPTLDQEKINRSVVDQISKKLFPEDIKTPSGSGDLLLKFTIPCQSICPFVPDYKLELSAQSFWSNSSIVVAASFCKTVTYFFFGWVTLMGIARALRQW